MPLLDGKAVIVTGAGRGLGRAYAIAMAREGGRVIVNDVDADEAQKVMGEIRLAGGVAESNSDSVTGWKSSRNLIEQCVNSFGRIDVLVNNAGVHHDTLLAQETEELIDTTIAVNLKGPLFTTRHALDYMVPRRQGSIINITSGAGFGVRGHTVYGSTKAGITGLTFSLAMELAEHNIRVNAISPIALTRMSQPPGRGGTHEPRATPESVAPLAVYLASDLSSGVTGQIVRLEPGALRLVAHPRAMPKALRAETWTPQNIDKAFREVFRDMLEPVGLGSKTYTYGSVTGSGPAT